MDAETSDRVPREVGVTELILRKAADHRISEVRLRRL